MSREIQLIVTITYDGPKANITSQQDALHAVRQDMTAMGIPHPKAVNVSVLYPGTVRFFWTALPNSMIHRTLQNNITPRNGLEEHRALLNRLSIHDVNLRELDPLPPPPPLLPGSNKPDVGLYAVPMGNGSVPTADSDTRIERKPSYGGEPTASGSRSSWNRESQPWIKAEPTDMAVPPPPSSGASMNRHRYDVDEDVDMDLETPPASANPWPKAVPHSRNRYGSGSYSNPNTETNNRRESYYNNNSNAYHQRRESDTYSHRARRDSYPHPREYTHQPRDRERDPGPPESAEVGNLRRELREVRRQLRADLAQERAVLESLRELGVDPEQLRGEGGEEELDFVTKARIDDLVAELAAERGRRRRAEDEMEDVRRECRAPFVVPALLDAFVQVSRLTEEVLNER